MAGIKKPQRKGKKLKVEQKNPIFAQIFSTFLIIVGFLLIMFTVSRNFNLSLRIQKPTSEQAAEEIKLNKIESINIPKIKRNLVVEDGSYTGGRWEVSAEGVSFYTSSALPGAGGNTVLYGHNKARILGGLVDMRRGDKIEIRMENGELRVYEVFETKTIKPDEVEILNQTEDERLTIYTCSGFLDSARFVVLAKQVSQ